MLRILKIRRRLGRSVKRSAVMEDPWIALVASLPRPSVATLPVIVKGRIDKLTELLRFLPLLHIAQLALLFFLLGIFELSMRPYALRYDRIYAVHLVTQRCTLEISFSQCCLRCHGNVRLLQFSGCIYCSVRVFQSSNLVNSGQELFGSLCLTQRRWSRTGEAERHSHRSLHEVPARIRGSWANILLVTTLVSE